MQRNNDYLQGRNNPNCKYKELDDNFFEKVNSEEKAYLLGWLASDGYMRDGYVSIAINYYDKHLLSELRDIICKDIPLKSKEKNLISLTISSKKISQDVCNLLQVKPGKKSHFVQFPELENELFNWAFIRGYFDGDGTITKPGNKRYPRCSITSNSELMRKAIIDFVKIPGSNFGNVIEWSHNNALDFMGKIYENAKFYLPRKKDLYLDWCLWVPSLSGGGSHGSEEYIFRWNRTRKDAVPPSKTNISDSGYDLVLLEKIKVIGEVEFYDTGIKIQPDYGWYFDLVPRSSISKTGYILANSIGIIDRTYVGNILAALIKIDKSMQDLQLPSKLVQIIPRPIVHFQFQENNDLDETIRGEGGFGSTGVA